MSPSAHRRKLSLSMVTLAFCLLGFVLNTSHFFSTRFHATNSHTNFRKRLRFNFIHFFCLLSFTPQNFHKKKHRFQKKNIFKPILKERKREKRKEKRRLIRIYHILIIIQVEWEIDIMNIQQKKTECKYAIGNSWHTQKKITNDSELPN